MNLYFLACWTIVSHLIGWQHYLFWGAGHELRASLYAILTLSHATWPWRPFSHIQCLPLLGQAVSSSRSRLFSSLIYQQGLELDGIDIHTTYGVPSVNGIKPALRWLSTLGGKNANWRVKPRNKPKLVSTGSVILEEPRKATRTSVQQPVILLPQLLSWVLSGQAWLHGVTGVSTQTGKRLVVATVWEQSFACQNVSWVWKLKTVELFLKSTLQRALLAHMCQPHRLCSNWPPTGTCLEEAPTPSEPSSEEIKFGASEFKNKPWFSLLAAGRVAHEVRCKRNQRHQAPRREGAGEQQPPSESLTGSVQRQPWRQEPPPCTPGRSIWRGWPDLTAHTHKTMTGTGTRGLWQLFTIVWQHRC